MDARGIPGFPLCSGTRDGLARVYKATGRTMGQSGCLAPLRTPMDPIRSIAPSGPDLAESVSLPADGAISGVTHRFPCDTPVAMRAGNGGLPMFQRFSSLKALAVAGLVAVAGV